MKSQMIKEYFKGYFIDLTIGRYGEHFSYNITNKQLYIQY